MTKYKNKKSNTKWYISGANGVFWVASEAAKSLCGSMKDIVGINFSYLFAYVKNHNFNWCTLEKENIKVGNFLIEKFKDHNFSNKFLNDYREFDKKSIKELNKLDKNNFSKISDKILFDILEKSTSIYIKNFDFGFIIESMDFVMPGIIEDKLMRHGYKISEIADAMTLSDISFLNKETQELIKILKSKKSDQKELLKNHAYKYRWFRSAHMGRCDIPLSYFENRLKKLEKKDLDLELKRLKNFKKDTEILKRKLFKNKPINKETRELIKVADTIVPVHDRRKEIFLRSIYTIDTARAEIAHRYGYTKDELSVFLVEDLLELSHGKKIDKKYARKFFQEGLLYVIKKKWNYYYGKKAGDMAKKELFLELKGIKELKGTTASMGNVKGTVKVILGLKDMNKAKKGDVIVSSMTRPEFIIALKKSVAIITDEGGVTCHAAIVSRELGIPCIIGTKIATKVLKDGDFVEVDANNGIVKILNNI